MHAPNSVREHTIRTTYMDITPDLAAQWLEGNVRNRRIDQGYVNCLAEEMAADRWITTHQGIGFDRAGTLIDGQHRLWAVLQSGCTIFSAVSVGLPVESVPNIDGGKGRSIVDRMTLSGKFGVEGVHPYHATALRSALRGLKPGRKLPYHQEIDLMAEHIDAVRFAASHVATKARGVGVSYVRAVIVRAWYSVDHDALARFCRVLSSGLPESPEDTIIIRLRDHLMAVGSTRNPAIQRDLYGKVERVLLTWLKGETRSVLRPVTQEYFPLPTELEVHHAN